MSTTRTTEVEQVVPERSKRLLILAICSMSLLIVSLDNTIVNVALPSIHRSFHSAFSGLQWTIDAYTLVLASLLMLSGSTADRIGRRRMFQIGLCLFVLGSALCGLAPNLGLLIGARVLQAIGGSMLNPVAMSIIRNVFTDPRERAQAIGVWGGVVGVSMSLGPVIGGLLVDSVSWRAVFFVNLPIGLLALLLTALFVPESRAEHPRRIDPVGQVLVIIGLASLIYAIIDAPQAGWTSARPLVLFAVSLIAFVALVRYENRHRQPLIEMRFFRSAPFSGATAIAVCVYLAIGGFLFLNTLYLQDVRGLSALDAGLYTLPMAGLILVMAPLTGRFVGNHGTRWPLLSGSAALIAGAVMLTQLAPHTAIAYLFGAYVLIGLGAGLLNPPITDTAVSGMPPSMAGVAAAVASTCRQTGQTLGVAVLGALAGGALAGSIGPSFAHSTHVAWWVVAGAGAIVFVLGLVTTTPWAQRTAQRLASAIESDGVFDADQPGEDADGDRPAAQPAETELAAH